MPLSVIVPPALKPVTLAKIKQHLRLDHDEDDEYLIDLLDAATLHVEAVTGRYLVNRTVRQYVDIMPASRSVLLEASPASSIEEIRGFDSDGNPNTFFAANYRLDNRFDTPAVIFNTNINYQSFYNGIEIDFVAGFGDTGMDIPSNIIRAILVLIAHWYEFRGTMLPGDETALVPDGIESLLASVRRLKL